MPIGFPGGGNFSRSGAQSGFGNLLGLGGGAPEQDYEQINALLQHFGGLSVSPDQKPQGLFENIPGISKRSPQLAMGLDNALIALANMGPTGATAGDNISNVARGLQSIGPTRRAQQMAPTMMALQMAQQVAGLQQSQANIGREGAMAQYYGGRNAASEYAANQRFQATQIRANMSAATAKNGPQIIDDGKGGKVVGMPSIDDDGQLKYTPHPEINVDDFQKQQKKDKVAGILGNSFEGHITQGILGDDPESFKGGVIPGLGRNKYPAGEQGYYTAANDILLRHRSVSAGISAGAAGDRQDRSIQNTADRDLFKSILEDRSKSADNRIKNRGNELVMNDNNADPIKARKQAQDEEDARTGQLKSLYGEYSLLPPDDQRQVGGVMGYVRSKGYDPTNHTFATPRTGKPPAGVAPPQNSNVMGGSQTPPPSQALTELQKWMKNNN